MTKVYSSAINRYMIGTCITREDKPDYNKTMPDYSTIRTIDYREVAGSSINIGDSATIVSGGGKE